MPRAINITSSEIAIAVMLMLVGASHSRADGDVVKGSAVFVSQCALCHTIDKGGRNAFGPNLFGITERKSGTAPGYKYSRQFLEMANWTWSPDGVRSFIISPANTIPGNKMAVFQGVADRDLDDVIAYLSAQN
jgi:cytochrome c